MRSKQTQRKVRFMDATIKRMAERGITPWTLAAYADLRGHAQGLAEAREEDPASYRGCKLADWIVDGMECLSGSDARDELREQMNDQLDLLAELGRVCAPRKPRESATLTYGVSDVKGTPGEQL